VLEKKRRPGKETLGRRAPLDASTRSVDEPTGRASNGAGSVYWRGGRAFMRLSLGRMGRRTIALPSAATEAQAVARAAVVAKLARRLLAAGQIELGLPLLERAASRDGKALEAVVAAVETLCKGEARARPSGSVTIEDLGKRWTSGELARDYPDHVRAKASAEDDAWRFDRYIVPVIGPVPVADVTLDHCEEVMRRLPAHLAAGSRRHVGQALHRLLAMAVYPLRLREANPLPRGWLPRTGSGKAKGYLYPDEERKLLGASMIALPYRVLYGFLTREGHACR
jgi:hypothetical protein